MTSTAHTHEWVRDEQHDGDRAWACTECEQTCASCGTCGRPSGSSLLLCPGCEKRAGELLDGITHALDLYEPDPRSPVKSPGNMRLVPAGPPGALSSPDEIESALWSWVAHWAEHTGADNAAALDYLRSRHVWAAHNPEASAWPDYLEAMRTLRAAARRIAGLMPRRLAEPCVLCGGEVVQDWADRSWMPHEDGLSDTVRCLRCGTTWNDRTHWHDATIEHLAALPGLRPGSLITLAHARMIWPSVPAGTMRQWAKRWRDEGDEAIERARYWWELRCAHEAGRRPALVGPDWAGPGEPPDLPGWLPQCGTRDGVAVYRAGDLLALVARWEEARARRAPRTSHEMAAT